MPIIDLSIVIVNFNTKDLLHACLTSIYTSLSHAVFSYEIIVVDNGSKDGSREMMQKEFKDVVLLKNEVNVGFGRANNVGIRASQGSFILLLNSDIQVLDDAIAKLYTFANKQTNSFIGAKLVNADGSAQTSCGPFLTIPVAFVALFLFGDRLRITRWSPTKLTTVDWVSGACLIAPKVIFQDDLLFDEHVFMYMEELDLLYRAQKKGYSTLFFPEACFLHLGSGSSKKDPSLPVLNIFRGLMYFYKKHYSKVDTFAIRTLLTVKSVGALLVGAVFFRKQLIQTYAKALSLVFTK